MKNFITLFICLSSLIFINAQDADNEDYIEFNDRNNVVHGVYLGLTAITGELDGIVHYGGGLKFAYVLNQKFEIGLSFNGFQSSQPFIEGNSIDNKLGGGFVGIHLEPILFSKRKVSLSFPLFIGAGAITYITDGPDFDEDFIDTEFKNYNTMIVIEPGISGLYNVSRYFQLEAGIKYRITNNFDLATSDIKNFNGFSAAVGIKVGVFNMGRNRYKKKVED